MEAPFIAPIAQHIWDIKYRFRDATGDATVQDSWSRVARAIAAVETSDRTQWATRFYELMEGFAFLPGGRILAAAGTGRSATMCSCFVMGRIQDSMEGVFDSLREGAITMQAGGGVGFDFSTLRPRGSSWGNTIAPGPVALMSVWDAVCATLVTIGERRGAMMGTLRCDHPDIEAFVAAKTAPGALSRFNCSVLVTDDFLEAVAGDQPWPLLFPTKSAGDATRRRRWTDDQETPYEVIRTLPARALWQQILESAYETGDPGVIFIDRVNAANNLGYCEHLLTTNPCGEVPLPEYGACNLGSFNLTQFVRNPFTKRAALDFNELSQRVPIAVRFLDNVIDASFYPLEAQTRVARQSRRVGLGITGLADALVMLNLHYAEPAARDVAGEIMRCLRDTAYAASAELAGERGSFPAFDAVRFLSTPNGSSLPDELAQTIRSKGMRNSHLTAIAPAGTISLLANNVSSGIEPIFARSFNRVMLDKEGFEQTYALQDYAQAVAPPGAPQDSFVDALSLTPEDHLAMQAAVQPYVDGAIAKTVNVPEECPFEDFAGIFRRAYDLGLKGCTAFRANPRRSLLRPGCTPVTERSK